MAFALLFPNFVAAAGITIIASILGIAGDIFGVSQGTAMWLMTGFMLTYASFMPVLGKLGDRLGKKRIFVISISLFSLGLLLNFITSNFTVIVIGRLVQGLGAAGILPIANALVSEHYPREKGKYLAMVNATYGLGMIVGINVGGITYDLLGWRWMFVITFIASLMAVVFAELFIKVPKRDDFLREEVSGSPERVEGIDRGGNKRFRLDVLGSLLFAGVIATFLLMMENVSSYSFFSLNVIGYLVALVVFLLLFVIREFRVEDPAIDLRLFKKQGFLIYNLLALFFGTAMFVFATFLPSYTQSLFGYTVSFSVYAIDPFALSMVVFIMFGGFVIKKVGAKKTMILGAFLFALGGFVVSRFTSSELSFYINTIFLAIGLGISMTPMNYVVIEEGGVENQGASAGIVSIMRSLGGVIGPAIAGVIMSKIDFGSLFVMDSIINAYNKIFFMAFLSVVVMFALSIVGYLMDRETERDETKLNNLKDTEVMEK